jgi:Secretion system C-terminal sorting domain
LINFWPPCESKQYNPRRMNSFANGLLMCIVCLYGTILTAQTASTYFLAPDFLLTDINGQQHSLYPSLNDGKIVVIAQVSTQVAACWDYHQTQALYKLHQQHGVNGTNQVRVLIIESDPQTSLGCLYDNQSCITNTFGNWLSIPACPIIHTDNLPNALQTNQYPRLLVICPDRRAYPLNPLSDVVAWEFAKQCPVARQGHNPGIYNAEVSTDEQELCTTRTLNIEAELVNTGTLPLSSAKIQLVHNEGNIISEQNWTGELGTYERYAITFPAVPVSEGDSLRLTLDNTNNDTDLSNNQKVFRFGTAKEITNNIIHIWVRTDDYGNETYWELTDDSGNIIKWGGNQNIGANGAGNILATINPAPGSYDNNRLIKKQVVLPGTGCYQFKIIDAFGDGICCLQGDGFYRIYDTDTVFNSDDTLISGNNFNLTDIRNFRYGTVDIDDASPATYTHKIQIAPNPVHGYLNIRTSFPSNTEIRTCSIIDLTGRVVMSFDGTPLEHERSLTLPTSTLPPGAYICLITTNHGNTQQRFVVAR